MDLRSLPIFALVGMFGLALGACDRAIDDRYAGLVVIPVEEVPLDELSEDQAEAGALDPIYELVSTDIPRVRPDRIPERESTPAQAANAANLAHAQAQAVKA